MRHLLADWNNWTRMERFLALVIVTLAVLAPALPVIL
jgi:hypothetical protein